MWIGKLQNQYTDFKEFYLYSELYGLHERLGFDTPEAAWEANPLVQGSVNPEDYKVVKSKRRKSA